MGNQHRGECMFEEAPETTITNSAKAADSLKGEYEVLKKQFDLYRQETGERLQRLEAEHRSYAGEVGNSIVPELRRKLQELAGRIRKLERDS